MKNKILLLLAFITVSILSAQQTAQYLIDGESGMFVLKQTGEPDIDLPASHVFCRIEKNGLVKIRIKNDTWRGNYIAKEEGWLLSELRNQDGNIPSSVDEVQSWFRDNTGKTKGSGSLDGLTATEVQALIISSDDNNLLTSGTDGGAFLNTESQSNRYIVTPTEVGNFTQIARWDANQAFVLEQFYISESADDNTPLTEFNLIDGETKTFFLVAQQYFPTDTGVGTPDTFGGAPIGLQFELTRTVNNLSAIVTGRQFRNTGTYSQVTFNQLTSGGGNVQNASITAEHLDILFTHGEVSVLQNLDKYFESSQCYTLPVNGEQVNLITYNDGSTGYVDTSSVFVENPDITGWIKCQENVAIIEGIFLGQVQNFTALSTLTPNVNDFAITNEDELLGTPPLQIDALAGLWYWNGTDWLIMQVEGEAGTSVNETETGTALSATSNKHYTLQIVNDEIVNTLSYEYEETANGSFECNHLTGVLRQWGIEVAGTGAGIQTIAYPMTFKAATVPTVTAIAKGSSTTSEFVRLNGTVTETSVEFYRDSANNSGDQWTTADRIHWQAIGLKPE